MPSKPKVFAHESWALQYVRAVYEGAFEPGSTATRKHKKFSWRKLNAALQRALSETIELHMKYEWNTWVAILSAYGGEYWVGEAEKYYTLACEVGNASAADSMENWFGRKPFRPFEPVDGLQRLRVGSQFRWEDEPVWVTSLHDKKGYLVACAYEVEEWHTNVSRVHRITHEQLKEAGVSVVRGRTP